jgi:iron complex outermembrane receptor protein
MTSRRLQWTARLAVAALLFMLSAMTLPAQSGGVVQGTISDVKGGLIAGASVTVRSDSTGKTATATADAQGHFSISGLAPGSYSLEASANGFEIATRKGVAVSADHSDSLTVTLPVQAATDQISVDANETHSIAAALAPMDALLDERSARTEITQGFIANYTSPMADYGEVVAMAPGTFTLNGNGVGLGQSKTYFRGFSDGFYDIDFDGLPFYDTNSPTHHSWAFFPSQWLGGIDFDRSPGTASTTGPTPFGGSLHLLSRELSPLQNVRGGISYGSWGTMLADFQYDSGAIGKARKAFLFMDVQHMDSKGYETNNFQNRNAGSIKVQYKFSDKTVLTGFSGVVWVDAATPNFSATRCQMYGTPTDGSYTCTGTLAPFAGSGIRFLLTNNADPLNYLDNQYNSYHVPTDFEYVGIKTELPLKISFEIKPYTYNYDNSELYTNVTPITDSTALQGTTYAPLGLKVADCNVPVAKAASKTTGLVTTAIPCGVDKYNSYRKYGELAQLSQISKFGIARAGMWYEWADTNRHQFPSDPANHWQDQPLSNFNESFWTNAYQPYFEYEFHPLKKLNVTLGTKYSYTTIATKQYADDGKTIGPIVVGNTDPTKFVSNYGAYSAWLPSADVNYRILSNWSAYAQVSTGTIVPPSSVFDYAQTPTTVNPTPTIGVAPKQQRSTTYQTGTVLKLKHVTLDMDYYHIKFQNSYSASTNLDPVVYYLNPDSVTQGFESEGNVYFGHGLSVYLNAAVGTAYYSGNLPTACTTGTTGCSATTPLLTETAPSGLWVANTPTDVEGEGVTYSKKGFDVGIFNKRVGTQRLDNGAFHNQAEVNPFSVSNMFFNYTVRSGSHFDQTKIRLSFNNLFDEHSITNYGLTGGVTNYSSTGAVIPTPVLTANGTTYVDSFNAGSSTPVAGGDTVSTLPGRSITLSVTFGLTPKR